MGLAAFLSQVAVTESLALQTAIVAALLRASAVFLVAAQVITSTQRERDDKASLASSSDYRNGPHHRHAAPGALWPRRAGSARGAQGRTRIWPPRVMRTRRE